MRSISFIPLALLLSAGLAHASTNLVQNGSFETGSFADWSTTLGDDTTFVDGSSTTGTAYGQATDGHWLALFGSTQSDGGATIAQSLATAPGAAYTLSFDLANDNDGGGAANAFSATVGGNALFSLTDLPDQNYVHFSANFTALSTASVLSFFGFNDLSYIQLDNVAVVPAVPEPSVALAYLAGLALTAIWVGKKRGPR